MARVLIVACGPSVTGVDLRVPPSIHVIAVNAAITWAPIVNTFFSLDPCLKIRSLVKRRRPGVSYVMAVPDDYGTPRARNMSHRRAREAGVIFLKRITGSGVRGSSTGLAEDPGEINTGNSAYGALGLAYHMRAAKVAMMGVDATSGGYAYRPGAPRWALDHLPALFASALPQLEARGIRVLNGSPASRVTCFERTTPEAALRWLAE